MNSSSLCDSSSTLLQSSRAPSALPVPATNCGMKTLAECETRPHSRATEMAVRTLSPVTIRHARCAARSVCIFGAVPGLSLFSKTIKPRNCRSDSATSLTRQPQIYHFYDAPSHALRLEPCETFDRLSSDGNHSEAVPGIVGKHIFVIEGNCHQSWTCGI